VKLVITGRIPELEDENWIKTLYAQRLDLYAQRTFQADFEALPDIQIELTIAHWEVLDVYFPARVEFSNLELICPLKTTVAQRYFLLLQKLAARWFSWCFWSF